MTTEFMLRVEWSNLLASYKVYFWKRSLSLENHVHNKRFYPVKPTIVITKLNRPIVTPGSDKIPSTILIYCFIHMGSTFFANKQSK